jgi:hypothetical protein
LGICVIGQRFGVKGKNIWGLMVLGVKGLGFRVRTIKSLEDRVEA